MTESQNLPFHPSPSKPKIALPPGACDAHCHVFGPAARFPFAPERTYTPVDAPKETLFELHRMLGIERSILVQASCHGTDNAAMLEAIAASEGRYRGVAMVDKDVTVDELRRLHEGGVRGVRFNFVSHLGKDADIDAVRAIVDRIAEPGWHAVVHFDANRLETLAPVLESLPVPLIVDHMGRVDASQGTDQPAFRMLLELMEDSRFWVKVCGAERISRAGPPFADAVPFARTLVDRFPDRVLWGTDWPHPNIKKNMPDDGHLVDLLAKIAPDATALRRLLVDNPTRLYWPEALD
ncbi:amidohydrolase family protein [Citreimonas salinaria]|uniref:Predicted metal-dependent hydrolase, TIM-barrel fold n=1 Tax=Citreimonas salinaria TaxID=321339 RepID=A0A1H3L0B7_9RHOB|nr:amidohydrolase family protein [Citreimonas salinaria]SDY57716.1 Predicted metal-dependent hydrolase, TIM-barrel fold [Citreimonas salinaria]